MQRRQAFLTQLYNLGDTKYLLGGTTGDSRSFSCGLILTNDPSLADAFPLIQLYGLTLLKNMYHHQIIYTCHFKNLTLFHIRKQKMIQVN